MKRVFVCSPYRGDVERATDVAREACRRVLAGGDAPFAPHLLYPAVLDDGDAAQRAQGIGAGLAWLAVCDEVLVVGEPTEGVRAEIRAAEALRLPIRRVAALALLVGAGMLAPACVTKRQPSAPPPPAPVEAPT